MTFVSRDAFARTELHSRSVAPDGHTCDWCGNLDGRGKLKEYRTETDGGRVLPIRGRFCSVGCMRTYHAS